MIQLCYTPTILADTLLSPPFCLARWPAHCLVAFLATFTRSPCAQLLVRQPPIPPDLCYIQQTPINITELLHLPAGLFRSDRLTAAGGRRRAYHDSACERSDRAWQTCGMGR